MCKDKAIINHRRETAFVTALRKVKLNRDLVRVLPSEVEKSIGAAGLSNVKSEVFFGNSVKQFEEREKVRLTGPIRTNEHVKRRQLQIHFFYRFEPGGYDSMKCFHSAFSKVA